MKLPQGFEEYPGEMRSMLLKTKTSGYSIFYRIVKQLMEGMDYERSRCWIMYGLILIVA
jgi:hypothetical protein